MDDLITADLVYRRSPIDCAMLESNAATMMQAEVRALFRDGGMCDDSSSMQLTWLVAPSAPGVAPGTLGSAAANSVASATNVRFFTRWNSVLQDYPSTSDGYIFFDTTSGTISPLRPIFTRSLSLTRPRLLQARPTQRSQGLPRRCRRIRLWRALREPVLA